MLSGTRQGKEGRGNDAKINEAWGTRQVYACGWIDGGTYLRGCWLKTNWRRKLGWFSRDLNVPWATTCPSSR